MTPEILESPIGRVVDLATLTNHLKALTEPVPTAISHDRVSIRVDEVDSALEFVQ